MNKLILILGAAALFAATMTLMVPTQKNAPLNEQVMQDFQRFKYVHGKSYTSEDQEIYRMQVFANNQRIIALNNAEENGVTYALNQFGDLTNEEFVSIYLGTVEQQLNDIEIVNLAKFNGDIDWRTKGDVQTVKNQGQCGSCWAFSAVGATESAEAVAGKGLPNLSEQQLVDCTRSYGNYGCNGGWPSAAIKYVHDTGLVTEAKYPYTARDGTCQAVSDTLKVSGQVGSNTCDGLSGALAKQPVSVCVNASNWQFYSGGVFSNCSASGINHAVLAVGITSGNWIIKNSWGTSWGEKGYITLATGNTCAVCTIVVSVNV